MCCSSPSSFSPLKNAQRLAERPAADLVEREAVEPDGRGVVAEPGPHAGGARDVVDHPLELAAVDERDPAGLLDRREQPLVLERERRAGRRRPGRRTRSRPRRGGSSRRCRPSRSSNGASRSIPSASASASIIRANSGFSSKSGQTATAPSRRLLPAVGDQHRGVGPVLDAQALADRAPAERAVEREVVRRQLLEAPAAAVARAVLAVAVDVPAAARRPRRRPGRRGPPPCPGRAPTRPSRPAASGSTGGRPRGRRPPRPGACGGGSAWAGRRGSTDLPSTRTRAKPEARSSSQSASIRLAVAPLDRRHDVDLRPLGQVEDLLDDLVGRLGADRRRRRSGSGAGPAGRRGCAGSRGSRSRCRPSSAGSCWSSSARC